jgi:hypothetical protein
MKFQMRRDSTGVRRTGKTLRDQAGPIAENAGFETTGPIMVRDSDRTTNICSETTSQVARPFSGGLTCQPVESSDSQGLASNGTTI